MAFVLTSLSGNLISAASAGFAPTNSADVSAIASAYVSGKQDTLSFAYDDDKISAINGSALAGQGGGGGLVTAIGTSESGITSINNTGLVDTAALRSADYSSLYVQEPLYISASGDSSYIGISGDIGGVDSATCSAIASSYAESAASSKQDTLSFSYDDDKISAINGSALAGGGGVTGDYVEKSAMPLEIGSSVSATDTSIALGSFATAKDMSVAIGRIVSATSASVALGGRASAGTGSFSFGWYSTAKNNSVTMGYYAGATNNSIALGYASQANASAVAIGRYLNAGSKNNVFGDYNSTDNSANTVFSIGDGTANTARHNLLEIAKDGEITMYSSTADTVGTGILSSIRAISAAATGGVDSATVSSIASAYAESAASGKQDTLTFDWDADSAISSINGSALAGQGGGASITAVSYDTATQKSSVVTATGFGIVGSATNYPRVSSVHLTDGQTRQIEANTLAPGAAQTASGSLSYTLLFSPPTSMWTTADAATGIYSPLQYGTGAGLFMDSVNFKGYIKGNELFISNTALGRAARLEVHQSRGSRLGLTGQSGSSTVNLKESELAIVNSAVSTATLGRTKLEFKSPVSGTGTYATNYINLYDMAESATKTISSTSIDYWNGKADSSALSSYALSADVSGTVDLVSTQSANWGGSALALSAGPGVKLEKVGDTLVAGLDETVLWSGACLTQGGAAATLSEAASNFEKIDVYAVPNPSDSLNSSPQCFTYSGSNTAGAYMCPFMTTGTKGKFSYGRWTITNGTSFKLEDAGQTDSYPTINYHDSYGGVIKVVGVNRTAGV